MREHKAFLCRLRPAVYDLLHRAAADQRRSKASLVEELIREALERRYASVEERLDKMLGAAD